MARNAIHGDESEAIAMTLLVIDLKIPEMVNQGTSDQVVQAVGDLMPRLLAYAGSFTIISFF